MASVKQTNPCWPGYEPVPGKRRSEEGSCRPKAKSKLTPKERAVRQRRKKQLDRREVKFGKKYRSAGRHAIPPPKGVSKRHRGRSR